MRTQLLDDPEEAAALIRSGQLVAFPTETVYGLGANALDAEAVRRIFEAKQRPPDNPLIVHLAQPEALGHVAAEVPETARALSDRFMPGPLTLILPRRAVVPDLVTAGLSTVGLRVPHHPVAHAFIAACECPVAAPSANLSGRPSPTTWKAVREDLDGRIAAILRGDATEIGVESTVVDCTSSPPVVLRAGALTMEALRTVVPDIALADDAEPDDAPRSPGARHRHYAPRARVCLVDHPAEASAQSDCAYIGCTPPPDPNAFGRVAVCGDEEEYARRLFHFFRECDAEDLRIIYCERVAPSGIGLALQDRLRRAAQR